ncbi:hypothetical protein [Geotalea toluenoxydans]
MWKIALLLAIVMSATNSAHADWVECNDCRAIAGSELELTRGGYLGGDGLEVSFGIEKAVFINGILQATSTLNVPLLGADSGQSLSDLQSQRMVVQNGLGNTIDIPGGQSGLFTFIQNSLDFAAIKNVTRIDATVNVLNTYRNMNLRSLINEQLINAMK